MAWYVVAVRYGKVISAVARPGLVEKDEFLGDMDDKRTFTKNLAEAKRFDTVTDAEEAVDTLCAEGLTEGVVLNSPSTAEALGVLLDVYSQLEFDRVRIEWELGNGT